MRRYALLLTASAVFAVGVAAATGGSIVSSFQSPYAGETPRGLAYSDNHSRLYHVSDNGSLIYALNTAGSVVKTFACPASARDVEGQMHYFWICTYTATGIIYQVSTTGSVINSFFAPANASGITYDDVNLWVSSSATDAVYRVTTSGSVVASFAAPGDESAGLDWDGQYLWLADAAATNSTVYQLTTTGSVLRKITAPAGRAYGVAFDGTYAWYSSMEAPKYIYRITVGSIGVDPASYGEIKALYR